MTEEEWQTRCGFHLFEERPLFPRVSARQLVLVAAAWLRRFDRYWAPLPASSEIIGGIFSNHQMRVALDWLERWADSTARTEELDAAVQNAREAADFARVMFEDLVEDNEDQLIELRWRVADAAADAVEFVREVARLCGDPGSQLADALTALGGWSDPNLPRFI